MRSGLGDSSPALFFGTTGRRRGAQPTESRPGRPHRPSVRRSRRRRRTAWPSESRVGAGALPYRAKEDLLLRVAGNWNVPGGTGWFGSAATCDGISGGRSLPARPSRRLHPRDQPVGLLPGRIDNGCIRLRNDDILALERLMTVSTSLLGGIVALGLLLLVLAFGMGVHPRDWVPKGLRERLSGLWEPSPLYAAADVPTQGTCRIHFESAGRGQAIKRSRCREETVEPGQDEEAAHPEETARKARQTCRSRQAAENLQAAAAGQALRSGETGRSPQAPQAGGCGQARAVGAGQASHRGSDTQTDEKPKPSRRAAARRRAIAAGRRPRADREDCDVLDLRMARWEGRRLLRGRVRASRARLDRRALTTFPLAGRRRPGPRRTWLTRP